MDAYSIILNPSSGTLVSNRAGLPNQQVVDGPWISQSTRLGGLVAPLRIPVALNECQSLRGRDLYSGAQCVNIDQAPSFAEGCVVDAEP